jgi:hypothetical protein
LKPFRKSIAYGFLIFVISISVLYASSILCDAGTGRNEVPLRFTRHSNIYSIDEFSDPTILKIFGTEISWHFQAIIS